ncbi:MAG: branched-chain amino acid ABC transporter permease [Anaerolineae bacterium]|nr:branched-chain amino acid ABC transporter permease [Anaerolineae bacterium]
MSIETIVQTLLFGALIGSLYGLAALGLSIVFGVLKILNVAHGELIMLGGYGSFWAFNLLGLDPYLSLLIVVPGLFLIGLALHFGLFARVVRFDEEDRIKNSLLIGFGLTLILQTLATHLFTADERSITTSYSTAAWEILGIRLPLVRFSGLIIGIIVVVALRWFLRRTYWGKAIRATAEDWRTAALAGIDIRRTYLVTFALGAALAGLAGMLVTLQGSVSPNIGLQWTLKALIVVVLAGLGSVPGTFLAGVLLGVAESASALAFGGAYRELVGIVIFLIILSIRPQGLFGGSHA